MSRLLSTGVIDKDAVIINGNSGDFISGGHIPENLFNGQTIAGEMLTDLINSFIKNILAFGKIDSLLAITTKLGIC